MSLRVDAGGGKGLGAPMVKGKVDVAANCLYSALI